MWFVEIVMDMVGVDLYYCMVLMVGVVVEVDFWVMALVVTSTHFVVYRCMWDVINCLIIAFKS